MSNQDTKQNELQLCNAKQHEGVFEKYYEIRFISKHFVLSSPRTNSNDFWFILLYFLMHFFLHKVGTHNITTQHNEKLY
jgi:hypothetical protein